MGAIYRRFAGKNQLLGQLETGVSEVLRSPEPELSGTVGAFVQTLADTFARHDRIFPELLDGQRAEGRDRGLQALAAIQQAFVDACSSVHGPDREPALRAVARTVIGSCVHRAATVRYWPDDLSWSEWAAETTEMALAYLALPGSAERPSEDAAPVRGT